MPGRASPYQALTKAKTIGPPPAIAPSDKFLNLLTGYPLPGEQGSKLDILAAAAPLAGPAFRGMWGLAANYGDDLVDAAKAIAPTVRGPIKSALGAPITSAGDLINNPRNMKMMEDMYQESRRLVPDRMPYNYSARSTGPNPLGRELPIAPSPSTMTEAQRRALAYEPPQVEWRGLNKIREALGVR